VPGDKRANVVSARRAGRRDPSPAVLALLLLAGCLLAGCGGSHRQTTATAQPKPGRTRIAPAPPDYSVRYPAAWRPQPEIPLSAYLGFLATGPTSSPACPDPLLLVRRQSAAGAALAQAVAAYNRVEELRRSGRRVLSQRPVAIRGAREAVLIEAEFPRTGSSGAMVRSYDLLALSTHGVAFHVFASGCTADLPPAFVQRFILSFDAATDQPGASSVGP
jgi:hypothetical protein